MMTSRAWMAPLLALSTWTAGCAGLGGDAVGAERSDGVEMSAFLPRVAMAHDRHAAEPSIAVAEDGTIFIAGQAGGVSKAGLLQATAWLWRSRDGGATWDVLKSPHPQDEERAVTRLPVLFCSCDTDVVTSPDGWVYFTDWWVSPGGTVGHFLVERSSDGGDTWEPPTPATPPHTVATMDRQWLLAGDGGFVALFWHSWDAAEHEAEGSGARVEVVFSEDHGATWSLPVEVVGNTGAFYHAQAHPRILADGTLMMAFMDLLADPSDPCDLYVRGCPRIMDRPAAVRIALSADRGVSWEVLDIAELPEGPGAALPVGADADATGRILVAYNARTGDNITIFTVESADGGRTWGEPEPLRAKGTNVLPWVAATEDGRFAVAWYAADASGPPQEAPADTQWHVRTAERDLDLEWRRALADPEPVVLGPYCFGGSGCTIDRPLGDFLSATYDGEGVLHVAYTRAKELPSFTVAGVPLSEPSTIGHAHYARTSS